MPVTSLTNLPTSVARAIELGPLDYQRKLGQALPDRPTAAPTRAAGPWSEAKPTAWTR